MSALRRRIREFAALGPLFDVSVRNPVRLLGIDETTRTCAGSEFWTTDPRTGAEPRGGE